jgi:hypothetical protein
MKKLVKGSKAAKDFMAKIRAKRKVNGVKDSKQLKKELAAKNIRLPHGYITTKKLSGLSSLNYKGKKITTTSSGYYQFYSNIKRKFLKFNSLPGAKEMINNEIISKEIKSKLSAKKLKLPHGYEAIKRSRKVNGLHKDTNSHNVNLRIVSGVELSPDEKKFLISEGKKSKGFKYRAKVLWGDWIVLKEKENGTPVQKFIVDDFETATYLAKQLNKGQNLTKVKGKSI